VIARLQMILRRMERLKTEEEETTRKVTGRLEEVSIEELIKKFGAERRTGVLTIYGENNHSGEIYFREGAVVNARFGNFKAEKAVYQMLPWRQGHYMMMFKPVNVEDEITVSNLGLLLQGFKRLQDRDKLLKQLPPMDTVFVKTSVFEQLLRRRSVSTDAMRFISLLDGQRTMADIIDESTYDDLKTLERLLKLYQQGFIRPINAAEEPADAPVLPKADKAPPTPQVAIPSPPEPIPEAPATPQNDREENLPQPQPDDAAFAPAGQNNDESTSGGYHFKILEQAEPEKPLLEPEKQAGSEKPEALDTPPAILAEVTNGKAQQQESPPAVLHRSPLAAPAAELLRSRNLAHGHLVIICPDEQQRRACLSGMTGGNFAARFLDGEQSGSIEFGKIGIGPQQSLEVLGIPTERKYLPLLEQLSATLVGYIVLVVGDNSSNLGYMGYLVNSLKSTFAQAGLVCVYHPSGRKHMPLDFIRYSMNMDEGDQIVELRDFELTSLKEMLDQLKPPMYPEHNDRGADVSSASRA
ncbi:MAG: DUF4388 domain-containing protein, partial [Calditrichaeota bacterium]